MTVDPQENGIAPFAQGVAIPQTMSDEDIMNALHEVPENNSFPYMKCKNGEIIIAKGDDSTPYPEIKGRIVMNTESYQLTKSMGDGNVSTLGESTEDFKFRKQTHRYFDFASKTYKEFDTLEQIRDYLKPSVGKTEDGGDVSLKRIYNLYIDIENIGIVKMTLKLSQTVGVSYDEKTKTTNYNFKNLLPNGFRDIQDQQKQNLWKNEFTITCKTYRYRTTNIDYPEFTDPVMGDKTAKDLVIDIRTITENIMEREQNRLSDFTQSSERSTQSSIPHGATVIDAGKPYDDNDDLPF